MGITALNILWLVPALTLTTQDRVMLNVTHHITAECDKPVRLQCNVSSLSPEELHINYLGWWDGTTTLCSVDSEGNISTNSRHTMSDFHCEYEDQHLTLVFQKVELVASKKYGCKLRSNQGTLHKHSIVELPERCTTVEIAITSDGPSCTFRHIHPDGEVHWFHGSQHLSHKSARRQTSERVDEGGWLIINSSLKHRGSGEPYKCSLKSSGRYIASALVYMPPDVIGPGRVTGRASSFLHSNGVTAMWTIWCFVFLLAVTLE